MQIQICTVSIINFSLQLLTRHWNFTGSAEELWFEPVSLFGSDSEEDEYQTVPDGTHFSFPLFSIPPSTLAYTDSY